MILLVLISKEKSAIFVLLWRSKLIVLLIFRELCLFSSNLLFTGVMMTVVSLMNFRGIPSRPVVFIGFMLFI